jgi:hypothetical protein
VIDPNLERFVSEDLYNELRWLLVSAASWTIVDADQPADHFRVMCMDSAFLHARNLLEFFTMSPKTFERLARNGKAPASCHSFGVRNVHSQVFERWRPALEARVMHLRTDRPWPKNKHGNVAGTSIKGQVVSLAQEVLRLWDGFAIDAKVAPYQAGLARSRSEALAEAERAARRLGLASPFKGVMNQMES